MSADVAARPKVSLVNEVDRVQELWPAAGLMAFLPFFPLLPRCRICYLTLRGMETISTSWFREGPDVRAGRNGSDGRLVAQGPEGSCAVKQQDRSLSEGAGGSLARLHP